MDVSTSHLPALTAVEAAVNAASIGRVVTVGPLCDRCSVEVTAELIERVPRRNLRIRRADFGLVWAEAERIVEDPAGEPSTAWFVLGVAETCEWLAGVVVPGVNRQWHPAWAPVSGRKAAAHEELIEAETLAAERWVARNPEGIAGQPGWLEGVLATLTWAWRDAGPPPFEIHPGAAG